MYKFIFNKIKTIVPKISETELIALRTGTVSIDRDIFKGKVTLEPRIKKHYKFDKSKIKNIVDYVGNKETYPNPD